ncbi:MAG: hypothetical protein IPP71_08210 [Bacteroidetes bacterium]|nr:hypothetical protein [Bacteroidota bacterium]
MKAIFSRQLILVNLILGIFNLQFQVLFLKLEDPDFNKFYLPLATLISVIFTLIISAIYNFQIKKRINHKVKKDWERKTLGVAILFLITSVFLFVGFINYYFDKRDNWDFNLESSEEFETRFIIKGDLRHEIKECAALNNISDAPHQKIYENCAGTIHFSVYYLYEKFYEKKSIEWIRIMLLFYYSLFSGFICSSIYVILVYLTIFRSEVSS